MPRINIEDSLFTDGRFLALVSHLNSDELAMGKILKAYRLAQTYWLKNEEIPEKVFVASGLISLFECDLAEKVNDGYRIRGAEDQFNWINQKRENGKKGGRPVKKNNQDLTKVEPNHNLPVNLAKPTETLQAQAQAQALLITHIPDEVLDAWNKRIYSTKNYGPAPFELSTNQFLEFKAITEILDRHKITWHDYFDKILTTKELHGKNFLYFVNCDRFTNIMSDGWKNTENNHQSEVDKAHKAMLKRMNIGGEK